jgi:5-enolpyruvylshikimate-3-phosphate synthase
MNLKLHKASSINHTTIHLPGSKSISNRILIIKALSVWILQLRIVPIQMIRSI